MPRPEVVLYTTMFCPYCRNAKALLERKGVAFTEIAVDGDVEARRAMAARAGGVSTVPQIFFGDRHLGGCDDLYALEAAGELDALLHAPADGEAGHEPRRARLRRRAPIGFVVARRGG